MSELTPALQALARIGAIGDFAMEPRALGALVNFLRGQRAQPEARINIAGGPTSGMRQQGALAVIPVCGPIFLHADPYLAEIGYAEASIDGIRADFRAALESPDVAAIAFLIDSPGGAVSGVADLAAEIAASKGAKPIVAITDRVMASGAYWIGAAADEIIATSDATLGSIGVMHVHLDESKMLERIGIVPTVTVSGTRKDRGSPYRPPTDEEQAATQARVDTIAEGFFVAVASYRGLTRDAVAALQADFFLADQAINHGLADRITTTEAALQELQARVTRQGRRSAGGTRMSTENKDEKVISLADHQREKETAVNEATAAATAAATVAAQEAERARIAAVEDTCFIAELSPEQTLAHVRSGKNADEVRAAIRAEKAAASAQNDVNSQHNGGAPKAEATVDVKGIYDNWDACIADAAAKRPAPARVGA